MSLSITAGEAKAFPLHPEGIFPAVCVDVIDLGPMAVTFEGKTSIKHQMQIVWETEKVDEEGRHMTLRSRRLTVSLHPKAKLAELLSKWFGKAVTTGTTIELDSLIGKCCTVVVSHTESQDGTRTYANIDAVSKPTKKFEASGDYDPAAARTRINEWRQKDGIDPLPVDRPAKPEPTPTPAPVEEVEEDDVPF